MQRFNKAMEHCLPRILQIHYAFGDAQLSTRLASDICRLKVAVSGELSESEQTRAFIYEASAVNSIGWIYKAGAVRNSPPIDELQNAPDCDSK